MLACSTNERWDGVWKEGRRDDKDSSKTHGSLSLSQKRINRHRLVHVCVRSDQGLMLPLTNTVLLMAWMKNTNLP